MSRMSSKVSGGGGDKERNATGGGTGCRRNQQHSSSSKCVPLNPSSLPVNPPSSPIPSAASSNSAVGNTCIVDEIEDDDLDVDVDGDEDEQPLDELDDLGGDHDEPDENSANLNHQLSSLGPVNNFAPMDECFNSSSEEDDEDGEVDESLERDESDDDEDEDDDGLESPGFLLPPDGDSGSIQGIPPDAQARLEAFFEAAGFTDGKLMSDPENLRKLTLTVSSALGEASAAINRMRDSQRKSIEEGRNDSMEEGDSLLALACSSGYFELARVLLAMGANVDDRGAKGDLTPLMDAASQGHVEIVRLLVSHGADVNAQSACGNSPLMYACAAGHEDIVRELLKHGARVEDNNENGHTPLMEAASAGHVGVAKILLEHGAGINTHSNEFKESALTVACYKGHLEMVRFLLEAGADQQHKTDEMHTALMEASMDGHVEVARLLLDSGAQVNMPADSFESPLTLAACGGHVKLAELLIERGANIEEVNDEGYTPLMEAAREGHLSVVRCLLQNNAKINAQTEETHETALTLAACGGFRDVVEVLCDSGADIELGASSPLMEASQEGHYQVVKFLLEKGANVNRETQTGDTALSYACENGHVDVVELLIEKGADPEHLSEGGRNPLMKACRGGHLEVIKYLLSKGADVNRQTESNDHTPLSLACAGGHISAVEVLLAAGANLFHKLKDNSTMIIEAARGGHTNVIRVLLDHAPQGNKPTPSEKVVQGKPIPKTPLAVASNAATTQNQGKSVLRKSRSTSTLDSATQQQQKQVDPAAGVAVEAIKMKAASQISEASSIKNVHVSADGSKKQAMSMGSSTTPTINQAISLPAAELKTASSATNSMPTRKQATPSANASTSTGILASCTHSGCCPECAKASPEGIHQHHVHVKRPAGLESVPAASIAPTALSMNMPSLPTQCGTNVNPVVSVHHPGISGGIFIPGSVTPAVPSIVPSGPPLVPSQVTAQTAISERPKAKANKPSARKQNQLQQQLMQQQLQQQQLQQPAQHTPLPGQGIPLSCGTSPASDKLLACPTSPNLIGTTVSPGTSPNSTALSPQAAVVGRLQDLALTDRNPRGQMEGGIKLQGVPNSPPAKFIGQPTVFQMHLHQQVRASSNQSQFTKLDPKQLSQIFAHQQQLLKGDKAKDSVENLQEDKCRDVIDFTQVLATGTLNSFSALATSGTGQILGSQVGAGSPVSCGVTGTGGSTTTTTTTTTVVVTHGNGETETLQGEDLPPGANEMIINAAAATFPLECIPLQSVQTLQLSPTTGVQFQTYPLSPTSGIPRTTTTMQTTTIINASASNSVTNGTPTFSPPILLPHPPPLPQAIKEAAASAGLVPPSGAPPPGALKPAGTQVAKSKESVPKATMTQGTVAKTPSSANVATQAPPTCQSTTPSATAPAANNQQQTQVKKSTNLAKRSRPFCPPSSTSSSQPRQSNQQTQTSTQAHSTVPGMKQNQSVASTQTTFPGQPEGGRINGKALDVDSATESNGETSLSIAAASGHLEVVEFLLSRKAHIEHRDKKGCTPLILAADGGHEKVVELLLNQGADIEAQSERTKDTALSLACTKGRYEVVDLLLKRGANKEHRNVSDYTPLSLAASGGYVNIIKLLLNSGAEINSRTGSKLGISPLMLAAMNGNTSAVKLLLDMGSDINAQIETNKNTALTLACFQGRQEVVQLLLERKANLEHRAKTGLTPLMEAANGGYVEVGKILIEKGADVNAPPVPATRDTALTIAADKGHYRFVELLLLRGATVDARNKKGCTPLWLACHGGHLDVAQILMRGGADMDAQDNRRISCLMAAFRKGHVKVIRWIVKNVTQFPSDAEMSRYTLSVAGEPDLLKRCQQCADYIRQAKDKQALEANKNASILLEELESERTREESKRMAAARRREKKKKKKLEKKQLFSSNVSKDPDDDDKSDDDDEEEHLHEDDEFNDDENGGIIDSGIDANSQGSNSSVGNNVLLTNHHDSKRNRKGNKENNFVDENILVNNEKVTEKESDKATVSSKSRKKNKKKNSPSSSASNVPVAVSATALKTNDDYKVIDTHLKKKDILKEKIEVTAEFKGPTLQNTASNGKESTRKLKDDQVVVHDKKKVVPQSLKDLKPQNSVLLKDISQPTIASPQSVSAMKKNNKHADAASHVSHHINTGPEPLMAIALNPSQLRKSNYDHGLDHGAHHASNLQQSHGSHSHSHFASSGPSSKHLGGSVVSSSITQKTRKDEGWKEVTRNCTNSRSKKINVPSNVISRVIGRAGCNINAIREATGAHIEVEKQVKNQVQPERVIQIKGSAECVKQAHNLITALMNEPDTDVKKLLGSGLRATPAVTNPPVSVTGASSAASSVTGDRCSSSVANILSSVSASLSADIASVSKSISRSGNPKSQSQQQTSSKIPASPPVIPSKSIPVVSPSIKKPTPVVAVSSSSNQSSSSKQAGSGKRNQNTINSGNSNSSSASFASKLSHHQSQSSVITQIGMFTAPNVTGNPPRNITPTPMVSQVKTVTPTRMTPTISPPPLQSNVSLQQANSASLHPQPLSQSLNSSPVLPSSINNNVSNSPSPKLSASVSDQIRIGSNSVSSSVTTMVNASPLGSSNSSKDGSNIRHSTQNGAVISAQMLSPSNYPTSQLPVIGSPTVSSSSLAPGAGISIKSNGSNASNVVGGNRPSSSNAITSSESSMNRTTVDGSDNQTPLEYSPFNYTFSKTTGWFPGDLANPLSNTPHGNGSGPLQSSHVSLSVGGNPGHSMLANSGVARAMNFASVAASGISSSLSTTTAQMTQANGNGLGSSVVGSLVASLNLAGSSMKNLDHQTSETDVPKAIASKAPGYRGNTSMGSPVLRMQQQQPSNLPHAATQSGMDGHLPMYVGLNPGSPNSMLSAPTNNHSGNMHNTQNPPPNMLATFGPNRQMQAQPHGPQQNHQTQVVHESITSNNHGMSQTRNGPNYGHHLMGASHINHPQSQPPPMHGNLPGLSHPDMTLGSNNNAMMFQNNSGGPVPGVPSNVVMSSRLNPKAPSFNLPMNKQSLQQTTQQSQSQPGQQSQGVNQSMNGPQQQNSNPGVPVGGYSVANVHQSYKNLGLNQQPNNYGRPNRMGQQQPSVGPSGWTGAYPGVGTDHLVDYQGLSDLANSTGALDPQAILSTIQENQNAMKMDDRRLPRPIGGERGAWKNTGTNAGNLNITPFTVLDCLDTNQLPQPIQIQPPHPLPNMQGPHTMGPHGNHQGQQQPWLGMYPGSNPQQPQFHGNNSVQQQHMGSHGPAPPNRDRGLLGRRFMDEVVDTNRILEMQQILDNQRMMNGSGPIPQLMHMGGGQQPPQMFPMNMDHMDHSKIDHATWDAGHLSAMEEKHGMGWGGNKWGN